MPDPLDYQSGPTQTDREAENFVISRREVLIAFSVVVAIGIAMLLVGVIHEFLTMQMAAPSP